MRQGAEIVERAREMIRAHCTAAETERLIELALEEPPRKDITSLESVTGLAFTIQQHPHLKAAFLARAMMTREDRERVNALTRFATYELPRYSGEDLRGALLDLMRELWPGNVHESRFNGALLTGVVEGPLGWQIYPVQIVKCMRETEAADRLWQGRA